MPDPNTSLIQLPLDFIDALSQTEGVEPVLTVGAQWLPRIFPGAVRGAISFYDGDRLIGRVARTDGRLDPRFDITEIDQQGPRWQVISTGAPLVVEADELAQSKDPVVAGLYRSGLRKMLFAPMIGGGKVLGTLSVSSTEAVAYSPGQVETLTAVGKLVASQARLMAQARNTARLAETDALTGLANRARLMRVLDGPGALGNPGADGRVIGVLHVDLDLFKQVNDRFGHAAGDAVLKHAAHAMREAVSGKDLVARVGGDEFIVVTRTDPGGRQIAALADRVSEAVTAPLRLDDTELRVGASIGTAVATERDITADRLIGDADMALYEVKREGRGGVRAYCDRMRAIGERRARLIADLHQAAECRGFEPWFQPRVALDSGALMGVEVLARWPHPQLGLMEAEDFTALAADAGLTRRIDDIIRAKGLAALRRLRADGWQMPSMSFNAAVGCLDDPDLVGELMWEVLGQGLDPADLVFEFSECELIKVGADAAQRNMSALAEAGFGVELDDFGAGYAAMVNLSRLPVSGIKIDGSMTMQLPEAKAETVLRAVVTLAGELGIGVTAEGVETADQFAILRALGCDEAQGYGVADPMPFDALADFLDGQGGARQGRIRKRGYF